MDHELLNVFFRYIHVAILCRLWA